jgi:hypothetical protein
VACCYTHLDRTGCNTSPCTNGMLTSEKATDSRHSHTALVCCRCTGWRQAFKTRRSRQKAATSAETSPDPPANPHMPLRARCTCARKVAAAITGFLGPLLLTLSSHAGHTMQSLSHSTHSSMQQQSTLAAAQPERALTEQDCQHLLSLSAAVCAHRPTLHSSTLHCHHATSHQQPPAWPPVLSQHCSTRREQLPLQLLPLRAY